MLALVLYLRQRRRRRHRWLASTWLTNDMRLQYGQYTALLQELRDDDVPPSKGIWGSSQQCLTTYSSVQREGGTCLILGALDDKHVESLSSSAGASSCHCCLYSRRRVGCAGSSFRDLFTVFFLPSLGRHIWVYAFIRTLVFRRWLSTVFHAKSL